MEEYRVLPAAEKEEIKGRVREALQRLPEVLFAYLHGSFLEAPAFRDLDVTGAGREKVSGLPVAKISPTKIVTGRGAGGGGPLKRVMSISLGSSRRNHVVEMDILGERFHIQRIGTDGDIKQAIALIRELDGKVDAFGMGGIDLHVRAGNRRYTIREALPIARAASRTPIVDGGGLKDTLEREVVRYLQEEVGLPLRGKKVLLVSGVDRFGMAEALVDAGCEVTFGDLIFILGLPVPLRSLRALDWVARVIAPIACRLPISVLYPTGSKQDRVSPRYARYYREAEIIAGDFHFIRRYMPERLDGKIILTNTVTREDVEELRRRGVAMLVTTTPELEGRSFGTNVIEGVLVALAGKRPEEITPADYLDLLKRINFRPRVEKLAANT